jgi:hypothetical protein
MAPMVAVIRFPQKSHDFQSKLFKKEATNDGAHKPHREIVQ